MIWEIFIYNKHTFYKYLIYLKRIGNFGCGWWGDFYYQIKRT